MRTLAVFGNTGVGKSEFLNAWLQAPLFEVSDGADSDTQLTSAQEHRVSNVVRRGIDTPGLGDSGHRDREHLKQMAEFFQGLQDGVNAFAIVINVRSARFDQQLQRMLKIANGIFNDPDFWNHVCIVFTNAFRERRIDKEQRAKSYRDKVIGLIGECLSQRKRVLNAELRLPAFFVDSPEWQTDPATAAQLEAMREFINGLLPLSTGGAIAPDPIHLLITVEEKTIRNEVSRTDVARKDYEKTEREVAAIMGGSLGGGTALGLGVGLGIAIGVGVTAAETAATTAATAAGVGAKAGMALGPIGAAIGAGVGVAVGGIVGGVTWAVRRGTTVAVKVHFRCITEKHTTILDYDGNTYFSQETLKEWDEFELIPVE